MRQESWKRGALLLVLAASLAACSDGLTTPTITDGDDASGDRTTSGSSVRTPARTPERRAECNDGLTPEQIERIRALYDAYLDAIAPYLRLIAEVEQEAREAARAGASRDRIAEILAKADRAKEHIAELTARLRSAIQTITGRDDLPCWVVFRA